MRMALCKVTTCDDHLELPKIIKNMTMKISPVCISAEVQARIEPPPILLVKR